MYTNQGRNNLLLLLLPATCPALVFLRNRILGNRGGLGGSAGSA